MSKTYSTDTMFPSYFVADQAPVTLSWAANLAGYGHAFRSGFTYADFGCGDGLTLSLLAAANPEADFFGIDINPDHITSAKGLATRTGLKNISFLEADFTALPEKALPPLDYATSAGIYTWLEPGARSLLIRQMTKRMTADGLAFVKYAAFPSGALMTVLGTLTQILGRHEADNGSAAATQTGLKSLASLLQTEALQFNAFFPKATDVLTEQLKLHPQYAAHDIGNTSPHGAWFHQVAAQFSEAGFVFCGQAKHELNAFADLAPQPAGDAYRVFCQTHEDLIQREEVLGLLSNRNVRSDIFGPDQPETSLSADLSAFTLYNARGAKFANILQQASRGMRTDLSGQIYRDIMQTLLHSPLTGAELIADLSAKHTETEIRRALLHLAGAQMIACGVTGKTATTDFAPTALDEYLILELLAVPAPLAFPSQQMGTCLYISQQDRIFLAALLLGSLSKLWALMRDQGVRVTLSADQTIQDQTVFERTFVPLVDQFRQVRLAQLTRRGMLTGG